MRGQKQLSKWRAERPETRRRPEQIRYEHEQEGVVGGGKLCEQAGVENFAPPNRWGEALLKRSRFRMLINVYSIIDELLVQY
mmetsp:Transcript_20595/g.51982  ORF Transcript_20595/g.51982 Transcript_20595/m.51982 type:complete len:82 (+) Transcript_20595:3122-3367(+)